MEERKSFAFETTLSGRAYARQIPEWRAAGYTVKLFFLSLNTPQQAIERVARRVAQGGHHIPDDVVRRRFITGVRNFHGVYRQLVDWWQWIDNSDTPPRVLTEGTNR